MKLILKTNDDEIIDEWENVEEWTALEDLDSNYLATIGYKIMTAIWENFDEEAQGGKQANAPAPDQKG